MAWPIRKKIDVRVRVIQTLLMRHFSFFETAISENIYQKNLVNMMILVSYVKKISKNFKENS